MALDFQWPTHSIGRLVGGSSVYTYTTSNAGEYHGFLPQIQKITVFTVRN